MTLMRTVLAVVPKGNADMVAAAIRTVIDQPDANHVAEQHVVIVGMLGRRLPEVKVLLRLAWAVHPLARLMGRLGWATSPRSPWALLSRANDTNAAGQVSTPELTSERSEHRAAYDKKSRH